MSSTCPYILAKTSQLFTAARITSQNESFKEGLTSNKMVQKLSQLTTNLKTLKLETGGLFKPPRLNMNELSMVASNICLQIRDQELLSLHKEGSEHEALYYDVDIDENVDCETACKERLSVQNKGVLQAKTEKYFAQYGISEDELHRWVFGYTCDCAGTIPMTSCDSYHCNTGIPWSMYVPVHSDHASAQLQAYYVVTSMIGSTFECQISY